jgi:hypothetical protein
MALGCLSSVADESPRGTTPEDITKVVKLSRSLLAWLIMKLKQLAGEIDNKHQRTSEIVMPIPRVRLPKTGTAPAAASGCPHMLPELIPRRCAQSM